MKHSNPNGWVARPRHDGPLNEAHPDFPAPASDGVPPKAGPPPQPPARPAKPRDRFSVWRIARRAAAAAMLVAALWWLVVPFFFPVTSQAVVNARTVQVRTPIDGAAADVFHDIGDAVEAGDPLMRVVNGRVDSSRLGELATKRAGLVAQRQRLAGELEESGQAREKCRDCTKRFYQELVGSLKASLDEATARVQSARVRREAARLRVARLRQLAERQGGSDNDLDAEREGESVAARHIEEEEAARSRVEKELRAAEDGFLFQRDSPYFEQRAAELNAKVPELERQIQETEDKLAALDKEMQDERQRVGRLSEAAVTSPVSGTVWKRHGERDEVVRQHETLVEVADRNTIFVEALLHQSFLNTVAPGCRAVVKFTDGRVLNGRVRAVRTLGGADTEASFAVNLACPDVKQVRVLIDFDPGVQDASLIGRHARVFIGGEEPGALQRAMMWLFGRVGV